MKNLKSAKKTLHLYAMNNFILLRELIDQSGKYF